MRLCLLLSGVHWSVYAVARETGRCDLVGFLDRFERRADVDSLLALLAHVVDSREGPRLLPTQRCHQVAPGIWEFIAGQVRVFWFYGDGTLVICTHGIAKKTQKTPERDRSRAMRLKRQYEEALARGRVRKEDGDEDG